MPTPRSTYAQVLGLSWQFYEAQRSGPNPTWNRVTWRGDSHLNDTVVGGWFDAGDFLKLNFVMAPVVGMLAFGLVEFKDAYVAAGQIGPARNNLRWAADYLERCWNATNLEYIGQIGDPNIDHNFWGRPEEQRNERPAFVYNATMPAPDLLAGVAGALAASAVVFNGPDTFFSQRLLRTAEEMYALAVAQGPGKYSNFYVKQTKSIYPSSDYIDSLAWAAGWLGHATGNATYLDQALFHWKKVSYPDIYAGWDSVWAPHAVHMVSLAGQGVAVPGAADYARWVKTQFLKAWIAADGTNSIVRTPRGLHYPRWSAWGNLALSSEAAALAVVHAKYEPIAADKMAQLAFARDQIDYALGYGSLRSYVVGYGTNPPQYAHHSAASCPLPPAKCDWTTFAGPQPNAQVLYGALVAGPGGVKKNATDPDDSYYDKRSDYVTNEVANDYNAGFTTALAGLAALG
jgi:endoglucanase